VPPPVHTQTHRSGETTLNKNADCYLAEIWERFVGSLTPYEFMETELLNSIEDAVEMYVESMKDDFPEIVFHRNDLKRYLFSYYLSEGNDSLLLRLGEQ